MWLNFVIPKVPSTCVYGTFARKNDGMTNFHAKLYMCARVCACVCTWGDFKNILSFCHFLNKILILRGSKAFCS